MRTRPLIPPELLGLQPAPQAASPSASKPAHFPGDGSTAAVALTPIEHRIWLGSDESESAPRLWVLSSGNGAELEAHAGPVGARVTLDPQQCLELGALLTLIGLRCSCAALEESSGRAPSTAVNEQK